jgi:cytochrome d ubiquinol oxidase subunit II
MINTIGPVWDANETWLVLAAGRCSRRSRPGTPLRSAPTICAACHPRGIDRAGSGFEFRGKQDDEQWRRRWDRCIVLGSTVVPLLWGAFFANLVRGLPIDAGATTPAESSTYSRHTRCWADWSLSMFVTHGAIFLTLKTSGGIRHDASELGTRLAVVTAILSAAFLSWTIASDGDALSATLAIAVVAALIGAVVANGRGRDGIAFFLTTSAIGLLVTTYFALLYPNVMPSTIDPANNLTIANASSSSYTLTLMSWVAILVVPFVLAYQA